MKTGEHIRNARTASEGGTIQNVIQVSHIGDQAFRTWLRRIISWLTGSPAKYNMHTLSSSNVRTVSDPFLTMMSYTRLAHRLISLATAGQQMATFCYKLEDSNVSVHSENTMGSESEALTGNCLAFISLCQTYM